MSLVVKVRKPEGKICLVMIILTALAANLQIRTRFPDTAAKFSTTWLLFWTVGLCF